MIAVVDPACEGSPGLGEFRWVYSSVSIGCIVSFFSPGVKLTLSSRDDSGGNGNIESSTRFLDR